MGGAGVGGDLGWVGGGPLLRTCTLCPYLRPSSPSHRATRPLFSSPLASRLPPSLPFCPALLLADVPDSAELTLIRLTGVTDR